MSQEFGVCAGLMPHNFTVVGTNVAVGAPGVSFVTGFTVWFVSYAPRPVFGIAVGTGGGVTVGVIVALTVLPTASVT